MQRAPVAPRCHRRINVELHLLPSNGDSGIEIGGIVKFPPSAVEHGKVLLEKAMENLVEHQERRIVFFWDELPLMLSNIKDRAGEKVAMEVLDVLRYLRQTHPRLRMVFTGSIGLHNVLTTLHGAMHANSPISDMKREGVPPLTPERAGTLALQLLIGELSEGVEDVEIEKTAQASAGEVDNIPFYIHHIISDLKFDEGAVNAEAVSKLVTARLTDPQDPWHLMHYRARIDKYYTPAQQKLALVLLDVLAADEPLAFDDLFNLIKTRIEITDEEVEAVRDMLMLLQRDHYIELGSDKTYRFSFPLIRRWWQLHRG